MKLSFLHHEKTRFKATDGHRKKSESELAASFSGIIHFLFGGERRVEREDTVSRYSWGNYKTAFVFRRCPDDTG